MSSCVPTSKFFGGKCQLSGQARLPDSTFPPKFEELWMQRDEAQIGERAEEKLKKLRLKFRVLKKRYEYSLKSLEEAIIN